MAEDIRCLTFPMLVQLEMLIQEVPTKYGQQMLQIISQNKPIDEVLKLMEEEKKQAKAQAKNPPRPTPPPQFATPVNNPTS